MAFRVFLKCFQVEKQVTQTREALCLPDTILQARPLPAPSAADVLIAWSNKLLLQSAIWQQPPLRASVGRQEALCRGPPPGLPGAPAWAAGAAGLRSWSGRRARPAGSRQRGFMQSVSELLRRQHRAARDLRGSLTGAEGLTSCPTSEPSWNVPDSARVQPSRAPVLAWTPRLPPAR